MNPVVNNKLVTRSDMVNAAVSMINPLLKCLSPKKARLILSDSGACFDESVAGMEGFSRVLWAIVPMLAGNVREVDSVWEIWKTGIKNGTDPDCDEYWGDIGPFDQRMVEMAVFGVGMSIVPDRFFFELDERTRDNLERWLYQINLYDMPANNWKFFRVLVNTGLKNTGRKYSPDNLEKDLEELESHYESNGWYFDKPLQRDYYTLWGFHFYSIIYSTVMKKCDSQRCMRFMKRTAEIAPRFALWFDSQGRGIPYGRSQTYRFAQSSFWSACALAGELSCQLSTGQIKGLLLRNMRYWFSLPIFDRDGVLSVGYGYPNLIVSEGYNSPDSPYWAFKSFAVLALGEDSDFWKSTEEPFSAEHVFLEAPARQLITRNCDGSMVVSYTAGNHASEHTHDCSKYEKFCYSTHFGFSVSKESDSLQKGAFDSMLAIRMSSGGLWHVRSGCISVSFSNDYIKSFWQPFYGVIVSTVVVPVKTSFHGLWHIRCHKIVSMYRIEACEGAFAVRRDGPGCRPCDRIKTFCREDTKHAYASGIYGSCYIWNIEGYSKCLNIIPEANTNMIVQRTVIPSSFTCSESGTSYLICAVYADNKDCEEIKEIPAEVLKAANEYRRYC